MKIVGRRGGHHAVITLTPLAVDLHGEEVAWGDVAFVDVPEPGEIVVHLTDERTFKLTDAWCPVTEAGFAEHARRCQ